MKYYLFLSLLVVYVPVFGQKGFINKLFSNEKDTTRKSSFIPIPVAGYSQEKGFEFGLGALYSYYVDRQDTLNRSSNFSGTATYSTKGTYNLTLKADSWGKGNKLHLIGEIKFKKMPFSFYGIGSKTREKDAEKLTQTQVRLQLEAERQLAKDYFAGVSIAFENYNFSVADKLFSFQDINGISGGNVGWLGVSQSYDTRNSNNYPTKGFFGRATLQIAPQIHRISQFSGNQFKLNLRGFTPFSNKLILGMHGIYYGINGKNLPFYLLPQLGNDEIMRGYYSGRFRDKNLVALQAELRYRYNNRFGGVLFAGMGTVFGQESFAPDALKPNYGAGLRYFFDPAKGLSVRFDYGMGEKKTGEKRQSGFYVSLAEAF